MLHLIIRYLMLNWLINNGGVFRHINICRYNTMHGSCSGRKQNNLHFLYPGKLNCTFRSDKGAVYYDK